LKELLAFISQISEFLKWTCGSFSALIRVDVPRERPVFPSFLWFIDLKSVFWLSSQWIASDGK